MNKEGIKEWITMLAQIATISVVVILIVQSCELKKSIDLQTESIDLQIKEMELEKRPYLYIEPTILQSWRTAKDQHIRTEFVMKNVGKIPASDIDYHWVINDGFEKRPTPMEVYKEEFKEEVEEINFPQTLFPGQIIELPTYSPSISPNTKKLSLTIKVTYSGVETVSEKPYWYEYKRDYIFETTQTGDKFEEVTIRIIPLPPDINWDREEG